MVSGIKHLTTTTHPNSTDYNVSKNAWEENHDIDNAGIPQAKIAADIQVIAGPEWVNPTGTGPYAIQFNTAVALSRLCWFDGTLWDYMWGGNAKIEQFILDAGTIGVRDCFALGTANLGTTLPGGTRG